MKAKLFISYSHRDDRYREQLVTHLVGLRRQGLIADWHDQKINPGEKWRNEIDQNLDAADCVLLLVTPDFLASDYCYSIEMRRTLERHHEGRVVVIPVIVRPTDWQHSPLGELEALPKDAKPVVRWSNRDSAWLNVIEGIRRALSRYELANTPSDHEIAQTEPRTVQRYLITLPSEPSTHHVVPPSPLARRPVQRHRRVLPFYLVCDESASMAGMPIDAINNALLELHREIGSNPVVADKTRFCLIGFSDNADVLMPLSDLSTVTQLPKLAAGGGTNYEAVFETLRTTIENDVAALERADNIIYRPAVFFLSNGYTRRDDWHDAFQALTDANWRPRPNILAFGFGDADEYVIGQVATVRAFAGNGAIGPADALREFANSLIRSIINSVSPSPSSPEGTVDLSVPDTVPGFTNISDDPIF